MKPLFRSSYLIIFITLVFTSHLSAFSKNDKGDETLIEITDKYNQVRLGLTNHSVYMILDEKVLDNFNTKLSTSYKNEMEFFYDSDGNFIPSNHTYLQTEKISIKLKYISQVNFSNGKLDFTYSKSQDLYFEDVVTPNGSYALENFFVEDLERFYLAFSQITSSTKP